jgi:long-chain acyl-CoA synthetase
VSVPEDKRAAAAQGMLHAWWAARIPDHLAVISPHGDRTYEDLNHEINRLSRALRARGLKEGDALALMCTNRPEFLEVLYAAQRIGLRLTPINFHLTGEEASYIIDNCEAKAFICSAELGESVTIAAAGGKPGMVKINTGGYLPGFEMYNSVVAEEDGSNIEDPVIGTQMLYTSGTTGRPKGVHRSTAAVSALATVNFCGYDEDWATSTDAHLLTGPLYHAAPLAFSVAVPFLYGVPIVVMDHWEATEALRLVEAHGITHTHMVPTMFHRLVALPEETRQRYDTSSLRFIIHGAAPCPVHIKQRLIEWLGPIVVEYYAATEGLGTWVDARTWLQKPGTVGKPVPEDQVVVADEEANPLPPGEVGLVWFKASEVPFEYFKDRSKTESSYRERHFTLGDMGYVDDDGFLFLTDRTANLIISGGVNIYPAEVDAVLLDHPAVADAAVIGVPNPEWGEEVLAVVELRAGVEPSGDLADELVGFCRARLAHYKCPRRVEFVDQLPRQDNGKIYKRLLRDRYRERAST